MANEAEIINNPDSTPGAVSTGYQLQNINLVSQRTGIDKTYVRGNGNTVIVEISGPVDVNGVLYTIKSQTVLTPPSAGRYYITLQGAGQYLTPTLGTSAGTFNPLKNARYDASNHRVLNWVIYFDGINCYVHRLLTPETENNYLPDINEPEETWITSNTTWTAKRTKYYTIYITGSGGDGGAATVSNSWGGGGGAGATGIKRILVTAGTTWTATFSATAGESTTFSDGTTTLTAKNGSDGSSNGTKGAGYGIGGLGGDSSVGTDITFVGGDGSGGFIMDSAAFTYPTGRRGGHGGASFYGGGGKGGWAMTGGNAGGVGSGKAFGSGGGGSANVDGTTQAPGQGKVGLIRIVG
jgi:hypothetical protein